MAGGNATLCTIEGLPVVVWLARFLADPLAASIRLKERHGSFVLLNTPVRFVRTFAHKTPNTIAFVVGARFNRSVLGQTALWRTVNIVAGGKRNHVSRELGRGLVQMNGKPQRYYRQLLAPPLKKARVDAKGGILANVAVTEIDAWPTGEPLDLWPRTKALTQLFSIDLMFGGDRAQGCPVADLIGKALARGFSVNANIPIDLPGTAYRSSLRESEAMADGIIAWAASKRGRDDPDDLLALLVNNPDQDGKPTDAGTVIRQVPTLFGAAYETCQNALVWTLTLLALYPDVQRRLIDEVRRALNGADLDYATVRDLPYLNCVVKEIFRIMPPVPLQYRVALQDTELAGVHVQQGTRAVLSPFLTNRDPEVFQHPNRFDPDRWLGRRFGPYEQTTFSAGPRVCPGSWLGTAFVKTAAAALLRSRAVMIPDGTRIDYRVAVMLSPRRGIPAMITPEPAAAAPEISGTLTSLLE